MQSQKVTTFSSRQYICMHFFANTYFRCNDIESRDCSSVITDTHIKWFHFFWIFIHNDWPSVKLICQITVDRYVQPCCQEIISRMLPD